MALRAAKYCARNEAGHTSIDAGVLPFANLATRRLVGRVVVATDDL